MWSVTDQSAASITSHGSTATLTILKNNASFHIHALVNGTTLVTDEIVGAYKTYKEPSHVTSVTVDQSSLSLITAQTESGPSASCQVTVAGAGGATTVTTNPKPSTPSVPAVGPTTTTTGQLAGTGTVNPFKYTEVFIVPQSRSRNGSPRITTEFFLKK